MTIKHRNKQLEKNHPSEHEPSAIDKLLQKHAKPCENDEEREEIEKMIEQIDRDILATKDYWKARKAKEQ